MGPGRLSTFLNESGSFAREVSERGAGTLDADKELKLFPTGMEQFEN